MSNLHQIEVDYDQNYDNTYWYYDDVKEKWIYEECSTNASSTKSKKKKMTFKQRQREDALTKKAIQNKLDIARSTKLNQKFGESFSRSKLQLVYNENKIIKEMVEKKHDKLNVPLF